jgi:hypothetical protein
VNRLLEYFCHKYPKTKVIIRLDWRYRVKKEYIICMDALGRKLRGRSPFLLNNTPTPAPGQHLAGELPRYFGPGLSLNLRFSMTKEFHEEDARRDLSASYSGWQLKSEVKTARWRHNDGI